MISILHISDLHIIEDANWNNMKEALLREVKEKLQGKALGEKLLVITGDLHNFSEAGFDRAERFLSQLFEAMAIEPDKDVFVIPGNHDIGNAASLSSYFPDKAELEMRQKAAVNGLKNADFSYLEWRMQAYFPYCDFVKRMNIYPNHSETLSARVHIKAWRKRLNLLHLNTTLLCDGSTKTDLIVDTNTATGDEAWQNSEEGIPCIALGHNSFFDLAEKQQTQLRALFLRKHVGAYLCGDAHKSEENIGKQLIRLTEGYTSGPEIPNVVCMRTSSDETDTYSQFGFYWHDWEEETNIVTLQERVWQRDKQQDAFVSLKAAEQYHLDFASPQASEKPVLTTEEMEGVQSAYFKYLSRELGVIQFDGMPTDKASGTVKAELEKIFVPLAYHCIADIHKEVTNPDAAYSIKDILASHTCSAILAKPGGGKSTLIRRMALAYAYPERKQLVEDDLPDTGWFPIYIRCRDLGDYVQKSIREIIFSVVHRAELSQYKNEFQKLTETQLQNGNLLLLIDGLDEISNEQLRLKFTEQLHTFLKTYPNVHLLITSRETGFRAVAQNVSQYCNQYVIAELDNARISKLSENWHNALIDSPIEAKAESEGVCKIILQDFRIKALAKNPLLLTTLLFVKRWIGYLPTKKCQLYQEMIKLLLVSWNAAAHHKMDMEETEPQLAFVAYAMTKKGKQTILKEDLIQCINQARTALPELLGYTKVSPTEFIYRVEERSSILIQQGFEEDEKGNLVQSYEFSHLSFQEYLTAKAIAESWIDERKEEPDAFLSILKKHWKESQWWEVIPLTAVLMKRQAKPAMEFLLQEAQKKTPPKKKSTVKHRENKKEMMAFHLANCIACETLMTSDILDPALVAIASESYHISSINSGRYSEGFRFNETRSANIFKTIYHSEKYGARLRAVVEKELFEGEPNSALSGICNTYLTISEEDYKKATLSLIDKLLASTQRKERVLGALFMMEWAFKNNTIQTKSAKTNNLQKLERIFGKIEAMLKKDSVIEAFSAGWCVAWAGYNRTDLIPEHFCFSITNRLIELWCETDEPFAFRRVLSWAICTMCRENSKIEKTPLISASIQRHKDASENEFDKSAACLVEFMCGELTSIEVAKMIPSEDFHFIPRFLQKSKRTKIG